MEEDSDEEARRKEEEDRAWWSDYQASTKLKRKWVKRGDSDEDFDDILGDLDNIVQKTEEVMEMKEENESQVVPADISRQSSTSGYLTDTNTPEIRGKDYSHSSSQNQFTFIRTVLQCFNVIESLDSLCSQNALSS